MGTIILLIALVIEVTFVSYCLITKSNQDKAKSYIRIGAFAAFILFTLASVIEWSLRWYLLAALLLIWAVLGARTLIGTPAEQKNYKLLPGLVKAVLMLVLVAIAITPALIFPQNKQPRVTGAHPVSTSLATFVNESQIETFTNTGEKRRVNVEFWYPADAAGGDKYPLVLFSHGSFGTKTSNTSTFTELASNGYVICSMDHPYHAIFTRDNDGRVVTVAPSFRQEFFDVNGGKYDAATELKLEHNWMNVQATDINFVLDTILANAQDPDSAAVYHMVDEQKIGLMGHSLGGVASARVARERVANGRNDIAAVVNLDADLFGEYVDVVDGKEVLNKSPFPVPIMTLLSEDMWQRIAAIPNADELVAVQYISTTAPQAYEIIFPRTNHMSFTDLPFFSPLLASLLNGSVQSTRGSGADPLATIEKMNATVLQFFNAYLKGEGSFVAAK